METTKRAAKAKATKTSRTKATGTKPAVKSSLARTAKPRTRKAPATRTARTTTGRKTRAQTSPVTTEETLPTLSTVADVKAISQDLRACAKEMEVAARELDRVEGVTPANTVAAQTAAPAAVEKPWVAPTPTPMPITATETPTAPEAPAPEVRPMTAPAALTATYSRPKQSWWQRLKAKVATMPQPGWIELGAATVIAAIIMVGIHQTRKANLAKEQSAGAGPSLIATVKTPETRLGFQSQATSVEWADETGTPTVALWPDQDVADLTQETLPPVSVAAAPTIAAEARLATMPQWRRLEGKVTGVRTSKVDPSRRYLAISPDATGAPGEVSPPVVVEIPKTAAPDVPVGSRAILDVRLPEATTPQIESERAGLARRWGAPPVIYQAAEIKLQTKP